MVAAILKAPNLQNMCLKTFDQLNSVDSASLTWWKNSSNI